MVAPMWTIPARPRAALGNWGEFRRDWAGDGTFGGSDDTTVRTHNAANELEEIRRGGPSGSVSHEYTHDASGNRTSETQISTTVPPFITTFTHEYDAWNRLVGAHRTAPTSATRGEYEYNGLHWRTVRRAAMTGGSVDQERVYAYSAAWQMIEERVDDGPNETVDRVGQQFWGLRYIDDAVARRIDRDADGDWTNDDDSVFFYVTDALFSVRAIVRDTGELVERVTYDAYGRPQHAWASDINGDGVVNQSDEALITAAAGKEIGEIGYLADADLSRTGEVDATEDGDLWAEQDGVPSVILGRLSHPTHASGPDNSIGFAGYMFNHETQHYHVRFRAYDPATGRWLQRDPIGSYHVMNGFHFQASTSIAHGLRSNVISIEMSLKPFLDYLDGMNLSQYVRSSPTNEGDAIGLAPNCSGFKGCKMWGPKDGADPAVPNGCGAGWISQGLTWLSAHKQVFTPCCDDHDMCYAKCSGLGAANRQHCDTAFLECMRLQCEAASSTWASRRTCILAAYAFWNAVDKGGGLAFCAAKRRFCECKDRTQCER